MPFLSPTPPPTTCPTACGTSCRAANKPDFTPLHHIHQTHFYLWFHTFRRNAISETFAHCSKCKRLPQPLLKINDWLFALSLGDNILPDVCSRMHSSNLSVMCVPPLPLCRVPADPPPPPLWKLHSGCFPFWFVAKCVFQV